MQYFEHISLTKEFRSKPAVIDFVLQEIPTHNYGSESTGKRNNGKDYCI